MPACIPAAAAEAATLEAAHTTTNVGVGSGSVSHHPAGVAHGPHPGAYEGSIGHARTDELAVMLDTALPLKTTAAALAVEDKDYQDSFVPPGQ